MLLSMTGYGRSTQTYKDKTITIEIRSLNSKFTDLRFKLPALYKEKEPDLRKLITSSIERGKVDIAIDMKSLRGDEEYSLNKPLFTKYYTELAGLAKQLNIENGDILQAIMRIPNIVTSEAASIEKEEWETLQKGIKDALANFNLYRRDEGTSTENDLRMRIQRIQEHLTELAPFEAARIPKIRQRMLQNLDEFLGKENVDKNRFEQEVLFYLEKIDINEEKVRLSQHCIYFIEEMDKPTTQKGRKLSFIGQEMGREINTLGSKAYSSDIQRVVVKMKDELEKVKEQVANSV